jgi:hypothetical protein
LMPWFLEGAAPCRGRSFQCQSFSVAYLAPLFEIDCLSGDIGVREIVGSLLVVGTWRTAARL